MVDSKLNYFVMGASHDKYCSREHADEKTVRAYLNYVSRGAACPSMKFKRAHGDKVDENKFLMPFCRQLDVPVMVPQVINALEKGLKVAVVGSGEVEKVVGKLRESFPEYAGRLAFGYEGDQPSLGGSISAGVAAAKTIGMSPSDYFSWIPLDMPFFHQVSGLRTDRDIGKYAAILDMNAREVIFNGRPEIFPRNYYQRLKLNDGRIVSIKEPNAYIFSADLDFGVASEFYERRNAGETGMGFLMQLISRNIRRDLKQPGGVPRLGRLMGAMSSNVYSLVNSLVMKRQPLVSVDLLESVGHYAFNRPLRVKAEHNDPFRLKDDDAWHDLCSIWGLTDLAEEKHGSISAGLNVMHPHADKILYFNEKMKELKTEIGVLRDFPGYVGKRFEALSQVAKTNIPAPIDREGRLVGPAASGEMLPEALETLEKMCSSC